MPVRHKASVDVRYDPSSRGLGRLSAPQSSPARHRSVFSGPLPVLTITSASHPAVPCRRPVSAHELSTHTPQVVVCEEKERKVTISQNVGGKQQDRTFRFDMVREEAFPPAASA